MEPCDTSRAARDAHIALLRGATNAQRFARMRSLSNTVIYLSRRAIQRRHPDWSEMEVKLEWVRLHYGPDLATKVRRYLEERGAI